MGLAASQARMLFLTSRKNDIEFNQMRIANDKITMSRESEQVSSDYNRALQQRKLAWAVEGGVLSTTVTDLTYNLVATQNPTNQIGQFLISDAFGRVLLSDEIRNKIFGVGAGDKGTIGSMTRDQFVTKFDVDPTKYPDQRTVASQLRLGERLVDPATYKPTSSMTSGTATTIQATFSGYVTALNAGRTTQQTKDAYAVAYNNVVNALSIVKTEIASYGTTVPTANTNAALDLAQYKAEKLALEKQKFILETLNTLSNYTSGSIGGSASFPFDPVVDGTVNDTRKDNIRRVFLTNLITTLSTGAFTKTPDDSDYSDACRTSGQDDDKIANKYDDYFTANGINIDTNVRHIAWGEGRYEITNNEGDPSKLLTTARGDVTKISEPDITTGSSAITAESTADYYTNLYYAIKAKGWTCNTNATDKTYLNQQLLNGNYQIEKIDSSYNWLPLSSGDPTSPVRNIRDDEAISLAESKYDSEKAKIETKENQLDLQMKNLDTERSEADTEIDSVKSIISKNVERSFKMFA